MSKKRKRTPLEEFKFPDSEDTVVLASYEMARLEFDCFVAFVQKVDPELKRFEAVMVAAQFLNSTQRFCTSSPEAMEILTTICQNTKTSVIQARTTLKQKPAWKPQFRVLYS